MGIMVGVEQQRIERMVEKVYVFLGGGLFSMGFQEIFQYYFIIIISRKGELRVKGITIMFDIENICVWDFEGMDIQNDVQL